MARKRFHGLKKIRLRQTFSKYNLYNLSRSRPTNTENRTFFQQKWSAKSETRNYHGETIREKQWTRMFQRGIRAVVPMDHEYLARYDGSEQAEGRGSGADIHPIDKPKPYPRIPYMNMVYAPTERRLDTAIFRALFASSTRQARQFVVHGDVKVNGKKMIYPGYQLNPGDMFQVEPERVLYATGAPKDKAERQAGRRIRARISAKRAEKEESGEVTEKRAEPSSSSSSASETSLPEPFSATATPPSTETTPKAALQSLLSQARTLLSTTSTSLTARRKQDLRAFQRTVKRSLSRPDSLTTTTLDNQLQEILSRMLPSSPSPSASPSQGAGTPQLSTPSLQAEAETLTPAQMRVLRDALTQARENPIDASKSYATPWRPREFLSAFAFVPRYLEVHQKVCAAVYLRHPVARPGLAEVPTPFQAETLGLSHNWYLRRR